MGATAKTNLLGLGRDELERLAAEYGRAPYRGRQLYHALYGRREREIAAITDLDREFRGLLAARYDVAYPGIVREFGSRDGSVRYLLGLDDGQTVEAVYMPTEQGDRDRTTLCISSQVGCAVDCKFCFTGLLGLRRNLTAGEIVGQVLALAADRSIPPKARLSVVFMGQGEPLLNLGPVMKAVALLASTDGCGIALRRITLSTAGIVPRIHDLARELVRPNLAISLNASNEEQRTSLMPINRKYSLRDLMEACRAYPLRPRERLTFEYVMLDGINDSDADARRVAELLRGMAARVNLIPYNGGAGLAYRASPLARVLAFQESLGERGVPAFIRISRGQDIMAACGQLSLVGSGPDVDSAPTPVGLRGTPSAGPAAPL
ncbi:MAG: 23S rRNA (adenine(2503)-C(2))-methyltransferase RlmN [Terriglobia bacterium]